MAILSTSNLLSEQRYDVADARRIESAVRNDFDDAVTAIFTNTSQGYIIRGFSIPVAGSIGSPANSLALKVDPGAVLHINASVSGTIFQTPSGTANQNLNSATNTAVTGSFAANSTNYVGIDYNRFADPSTNVTKYIWNSSSNDEFTTIAPAAQTLTFQIYITTSVWAANVLPVAIVTTDSNSNVISITDARWMMYSLETGGINPNPNYVYPWSQGRNQPPVTTTSDAMDPFNGGDKQLTSQKDWENAVMTMFLEIKGTPYWFSGSSGGGPIPSIVSLFQDLGNTVITGSGDISNGILPGSDPILVTTGTITVGSNQLTSLASVAGLSDGDYIFATGIPTGTKIIDIVGSTITMSQEATLNGTGLGISFYSPSVITTPGQINWDAPINIRVIGSELTYTISQNGGSSDISLADDEVAYINLIREVPISPKLIFTGGSPTVTSVGAVSWTSGLQANDYIKVAADTSSGYYKILTINSTSSVTLTSNVAAGDNTGPSGAPAQYAFGTYNVSPSPSSTRDIFISSRADVPINKNLFWLFLREDNGGSARVYIRFLSQELDNGQSVEVSGTTSQELLEYIGSASAAASKPQYVSALNPGSVSQITSMTVGSGATILTEKYFLIHSSGNYRNYYVWFKVDGLGVDPHAPSTNASIQVNILSSDSANTVAIKLANAFNTSVSGDFSAVPSGTNVVVTNTSAGGTNNASNFNVGPPFALSTTRSGTGTGNYAIHDGDNLTLAIKEVDSAIGQIKSLLDEPTYDETVEIVASGATPPSSLNGPISANAFISLPNNSRLGNIQQDYTVGKGILEVYLNGQFLTLGNSWVEVGTADTQSNQIQILIDLEVGDEVQFRIDINGGNGGLQGPAGPAGPTGATGAPGFNAAGGPVPISTKTSSYTVLNTDCFLAADATSGAIVFTLFTSVSNTGRIIYIKKVDASANPITIVGNGSDTIDGAATFSLTIQNQSVSLINKGSGWYVF